MRNLQITLLVGSLVVFSNYAASSNVTMEDSAVSHLEISYDCRRVGHDCVIDNTNYCDQEHGFCSCKDGYSHFDCSYKLESAKTPDQCNGGEGCGPGVCVQAAGEVAYCACPFSYYGDACETPRVQLRCSGSEMELSVSPYMSGGQFDGVVFPLDIENSTKVEDATCAFKATNGKQTFTAAYEDLESKCGGESEGNDTHSFKFVVQSDKVWLTSFDQIITATCSVNVTQEYLKTITVNATGLAGVRGPDGKLLVGEEPAEISNDLSGVGTEEIVASRKQVEFIEMKPKPKLVLGKANVSNGVFVINELEGPVKIGDVITFSIINENDTYFTSLRAEQCQLSLGGEMKVTLIHDQCPASRLAWSLLMWQNTLLTDTSVSFFLRIPAQAFSGRPKEVTISCQVKMCSEETRDLCAVRENACGDQTKAFLSNRVQISNYGRKRRSADRDGATQLLRVKRSFRIQYDDDVSAATTRRPELSLFIVTSVLAIVPWLTARF